MPATVKIATFNCENLFNRPKVFAPGGKRTDELLGFAAQLQNQLRNAVFDHAAIDALKQKLRGYVTINDVRGKHTSTHGADEWLGWIEFTKAEVDDVAVENTARVIADVNADIICLMEVENRTRLQQFHDELLFPKFLLGAGSAPYQHVLLVDGNDGRGIDVALLSRLPVNWLRSHIHEQLLYFGRRVPTFSRDCLEVQLRLPGRRNLYLLVNHLKSQGYSGGNDPQGKLRRLGQAERVAEIAGQYRLQSDYVVVAGDLNSDGRDGSLEPLLTNQQLYNVNQELSPEERGTFRTGKQQLDYLLVSQALRQKLRSVMVERRGIWSKTRATRGLCYPTVISDRTAASDHGAVSAEFLF